MTGLVIISLRHHPEQDVRLAHDTHYLAEVRDEDTPDAPLLHEPQRFVRILVAFQNYHVRVQEMLYRRRQESSDVVWDVVAHNRE
jgi:hypothetical protein